MTELEKAISQANASHSADTQRALYADVAEQIGEIEVELQQSSARVEQYRDAIRAERASASALRKQQRKLLARKRVFARARFALEQIDEAL